jgi:cell division protein FtsI/penicillin-binding protein 2
VGAGRTRWVVAGAAAVLVAALVASLVVVTQRREREQARDRGAQQTAQAVVDAWESGDLSGAPVDGEASEVQKAYATLVGGMGDVEPSVSLGRVTRSGATATAPLEVTWPVGGGWTYQTSLELTGDLAAGAEGGAWTAGFGPAVVHPDLEAGDRLVASRTPAARGDVLGRDGTPVVTAGPVVEVGVQPSRATDVPGLSRALADVLDVDAAALQQRVSSAGPDAFVPVLTLRRSDYDAVRDRLQPLAGTVFRESTLPLAPTREFARALLGTAGPATAEVVEASGGRLAAGDVAGLSGLQRQYDERLGGVAGVVVERVSGQDRTALHTVEPVAGEPVRLTLDARVQRAADAALASGGPSGLGNGNAALVAVDVPSGEVLAVANTPVPGANRAMTGRYPPGSTFKTVSTLALLGTGLTPQETVACPPTATVEGRSFRNFEGGAIGDVPFRTDFAQSCNAAFVGLSSRLSAGDLRKAASSLGLGEPWDVGVVGTFPGEVPDEDSAVEIAAATIGQGEVLASPLAMAQAVSGIARGRWAAPRLVADPAPAGAPPQVPAADPAALATVRDLMRQVVVDGTASALADVPGPEPVHAKTGTAEYGTESPPRTHAWTVGFAGTVAFAVLVEDGESGGAVAVPVAEAFLRALG